MKNRILWATLLVLASCLLPLGGAVAYIGENPYIVRLSAPREVGCDETVTITAKVRSSDTSDPAVEQTVLWDLKTSLSPDDTVSPASTSTDSEGTTSAVLTFGQIEGQRTVRVDIATWPTTIRVSCVGALLAVSPSPSASATVVPTVAPSATPTAAPTAAPIPAPATGNGTMTAAVLPLALGLAIVLGLGSLLLRARRR
jgi:hypothetical protein